MANNTTNNTVVGDTILEVSAEEFYSIMIIWFIYCCTGKWSFNCPLRILTLLCGLIKALVSLFDRPDLVLGMFITYAQGRLEIGTTWGKICQGVAIVIWQALDIATMFFKPVNYVVACYEFLMAIALLAYHMIMILKLQKRGRGRWLCKLGAVVLWGLGWGTLAALYWLGCLGQLAIVVWFMTYAAIFPKSQDGMGSPGVTPPPVLNSPWISSLAQRRLESHL